MPSESSAFTKEELEYMNGEQRLARVATVGKDGTPHVVRADEPTAGFNLLECGTLEEAVEVSATHPIAKHGSLELRAIAA